jgi:hypothetical protein
MGNCIQVSGFPSCVCPCSSTASFLHSTFVSYHHPHSQDITSVMNLLVYPTKNHRKNILYLPTAYNKTLSNYLKLPFSTVQYRTSLIRLCSASNSSLFFNNAHMQANFIFLLSSAKLFLRLGLHPIDWI